MKESRIIISRINHRSVHCNTSRPQPFMTPVLVLSCRPPLCLGPPAAPLLGHPQHPHSGLERCQLLAQHRRLVPLAQPQPPPLVQQQHQHQPLGPLPLPLGLHQHQPLVQGLVRHQHQLSQLPAHLGLVQPHQPLPCLAPPAQQPLAEAVCLAPLPAQHPAPPLASTSQLAKPPSPQQPLEQPLGYRAPTTCLGRQAAR